MLQTYWSWPGRRFVALTLGLFAFSFGSSRASAQVVPPSIVELAEAEYPQAAIDANRGEVVLTVRVVVETDGSVSDATVIDARGDGLDEAAVAAALRCRFEPATRDGTAIRAAVRLEIVLRPPAPPGTDVPPEEPPAEEPVEPPPPTGRLAGRLLDAVDQSPLGEVDVVVTDAAGVVRAAQTDADGRFLFESLPVGEYSVALRPIGLPERVEREAVVDGEETSVTYRIQTRVEDAAGDDDIGASASVDPPPREVTRRTLPREVLNSIPGTRGDPLRAIEILPGIARPPFGIGLVIVRGSAPGDSEVLLDGVPIPLLYHFGGLTSVFNGRLLERIDFYPGNFSSRYGRKMGGIIEVDTRDPRTDRIHGNVELSVIDASIMLEGPVTDRFALAGSVRRSFIDTWFGAVAPSGLGVTAAPTYYDYQLLGTWRPNERDRVRFRFYGSDDRFKIFLGDSLADDPSARGALGLATRFNFFQTNWQRQMSERTTQNLVFQTGPTRLRFGFGRNAQFDLQSINFFGRAEWTSNLNEHVRIVGGLDVSSAAVNISYLGGAVGQSEGNQPDQSQAVVSLEERVFNFRPGGYVDLALTYGPWLVNTALRLDYYSEINDYSIDPRIVVNYRVNDDVRIKAGVGVYSQPPEFQESAPDLGNPDLEPIHSAHFGTGVDWNVAEGISLGIEGFYKQLWNRVIGTVGGVEPTFVNGGIGRIYGMEISGRLQPTESRDYYGYLSYTLMRSERRDREGTDWRPFDFDQTHIFTATFAYRLPRHWEVGGTLRLVTGNPYTPIIGGVFDPIQRTYYPISGAPNSERNPLFNRLDVRIEKQWWFDGWKLALFLDIQNAYNQMNQEGLIYNYNFTRTSPINGLPIIPALGVRGEF